MSKAVVVTGLIKRYGSLAAVDDISFAVTEGEVFGLLGPNGAGKTTTVEMIEGLRKPDSGSIIVNGIDAVRQPARLKEIIGVQLQSTTLHDQMKVREVIELFGSYYSKALPADELLAEVSMSEKHNSYIRSLSGGQKQRVALALALVNDPQVLFLDEPTTGLDPQARHNVWGSIDKLKKQGKTIILTTHYMEEAEVLCDRVGIMDFGKIIAMGPSAQLVNEAGFDSAIEFSCQAEQSGLIIDKLKEISRIIRGNGTYTVFTNKPSATMLEIASLADKNNIILTGLMLKQANLEDLFLSLTGRHLRD